MKHVYYHVRNELPVYVRYRIEDAWGWCTGMIQRNDMGWEVGGGSGLGTHVHPWWIHVNVRQNQYSIVKQNKVKIKIKQKILKKKNIEIIQLVLEKERATHSSILAWKIPWAEEPGGLQSTGSQKSQTQLSD